MLRWAFDMSRRPSRSGDEVSVSTALRSLPAISPDGAILSVVTGAQKGRALRIPGQLGAAVTVGKAPDNDLVLSDSTVSRRHLSVSRTEAGIEVVDLGSKNGVFVGSTRIQQAIVEPGTLLRAGDVQLLVAIELKDVVIPPSEADHFGIAVGSSLPMRRIFGVLEHIAPTPATVLLTGETGTGKDVLARSIHAKSRRSDGPFEVVDCGAVAGSLIESELFGHERGAFTGAVSGRAGAFERAAGGTIFLDEIGELALELQPKVLRVLEAREYRRVGGSKMLPTDVRIVAATTRDLPKEVSRGAFREDLYFRLAVVSIAVPPLRDRTDDLPRLAARILEAAGSDLRLKGETLASLRAYDWPGNVRELRNVIERAMHFSRAAGSSELRLADFPPAARGGPGQAGTLSGSLSEFDVGQTYREARARFEAAFEQNYVAWLLERFDGNVSAAARGVKMDRNHLADLARRHGLDKRRP
jgi:transcriptional regulator with GAF, ATPase, and Fis domain